VLLLQINLIKMQIKDKDKNRHYLCNVKARKTLVLDRIEQQEEDNLKLRNQYDEMKKEHEDLDKEVESLNSTVGLELDTGKNKTSDATIENAASRLRAFKEGDIDASNNEHDSFINGSKIAKDSKDTPSLETLAVESQRAFNDAAQRLASELKSVDLCKIACATKI